MEFKHITSFGVKGGRVTYLGRPLALEQSEAPLAQFEVGDLYLLIFPDDPFEDRLLHVVLLNQELQLVQQHASPLRGKAISYSTKFEVRADQTLLMDAGEGSRWVLTVYPRGRYEPGALIRRIREQWLPLFELSLLVRPSRLGIREAQP